MAQLPLTTLTSLTASPQLVSGAYGTAVAISGDGLVMAVDEAQFDINPYYRCGRVLIYDWVTNAWVYRGQILGPAQATDDQFGNDLSLNSDGSILVAGFKNGSTGHGEARTYTWGGSSWTEDASPLYSPSPNWNNFGARTALSGDGSVLFVTESWATNDVDSNVTGIVHVYDRSGSAWVRRETLPPGQISGDMGYSLATNYTGNIAIVGRWISSYSSIEVFDYSGSSWSSRCTFDFSTATYTSAHYADSLAFAYTSNTVLVGAPFLDDVATNGGRVYVYGLGASSLSEIGYIDRDAYDSTDEKFGSSIGVDATFTRLSIGAPGEDNPVVNAGEVDVIDPFFHAGSGLISLNLQVSGEGYSPPLGQGDITIPVTIAATGLTGVLGEASVNLIVNVSGTGALFGEYIGDINSNFTLQNGYESYIGKLNTDYSLPHGNIKYVGYLDSNHNLPATSGILQGVVDTSFALNRYGEFLGSVDSTFEVSIYRLFVGSLVGSQSLRSYEESLGNLNSTYSISALLSLIGSLDSNQKLHAYTDVIGVFSSNSSLKAYEFFVGAINSKFGVSVFETIIASLDSDFSINRYTSVVGELSEQFSLLAYQAIQGQVDAQFMLSVHEELVGFISSSFSLLANELFYSLAVNLETSAVSEYTGFNFNSISNDLAANNQGIYTLAGNSPANASLTTGKLDFGSSSLKRITDAYLGILSDGTIQLTVTTENDSTTYKIDGTGLLETLKQNLGRGAVGRYWEFKLENLNNSSMEIDTIEVLPQILSRRR